MRERERGSIDEDCDGEEREERTGRSMRKNIAGGWGGEEKRRGRGRKGHRARL